LRKFGCQFSESENLSLFKKYDKNDSGKIAYDEFAGVFALMGTGTNINVNPVFEIQR